MQPLEFQPILKQARWGGSRLGRILGKPIGAADNWAESWEIADHGTDQSLVAAGPHAGRPLHELIKSNAMELLGRHVGFRQFPLLVKFLDAHDRLSLQVHPDDAQAGKYDIHGNGKTEAWVILSADPESRLYAGLKAGIDRETLERSLAEGSVEDCLHSFPVASGDCVFIPAGTVHAIGEGILLAEIQQSSDLTFRLFDWGRLGSDGKPRPLHIEPALACIDFDRGPVEPVAPLVSSSERHQIEELVRSEYFVIYRHRARVPFEISQDDRFHILMPLAGDAELISGDDKRHIGLGQTVLLPATREETRLIPANEIVLLETFLL